MKELSKFQNYFQKYMVLSENIKELNEKFVTAIKKSSVNKNLANKGWGNADDYIEVFKLPSKSNEYKDSLSKLNSVRLGSTADGSIYFWNGEVLHQVISQTLNIHWDLALVYKDKSDTIILSQGFNVTADAFKKYLETDKLFRVVLKEVMDLLWKVKYIEVAREKIDLRKYNF